MVLKPILRFVITPVAVAGILILAIMSATAYAQENNSTGNGQENNNAANAPSSQENNNATNAPSSQENNNAANAPSSQQSSSSVPTPNNTTSSSGSTASNNTGNASGDFAQQILAVHNSERAAVGVPPLVWSDKLAASAKTWAEHLATTAEFRHSLSGVGENIAGYSPSRGPFRPGVYLWVAEKANYHGKPEGTPQTPDNPVVGHYTQMVWNTTKSVGCATASGNGHPYFSGASKPADFMSILVCQYSPPGNIFPEKPY
jgi:uncharacterized protein YkwD